MLEKFKKYEIQNLKKNLGGTELPNPFSHWVFNEPEGGGGGSSCNCELVFLTQMQNNEFGWAWMMGYGECNH